MEPAAFTTRHTRRVRALENEIGVSEPSALSSDTKEPDIYEVTAIWDTGATNTVITSNVIERLGLTSIDEIDIRTANGLRRSNVYLVNIYLPNRVVFTGIPVIDGDIHGADVLIGMDIIGASDFSITHKNNTTTLSFQIPHHLTISISSKKLNQKRNRKGFRPHGKRKQPDGKSADL